MNYPLFHLVSGFEVFENMGFQREAAGADEPKNDRWYLYFGGGRYLFIDVWMHVFMGREGADPFWVKVEGVEELECLIDFMGKSFPPREELLMRATLTEVIGMNDKDEELYRIYLPDYIQ